MSYFLLQSIFVWGFFGLLARTCRCWHPLLLLPAYYIGPIFIFAFSGLVGFPLVQTTQVIFLFALFGLLLSLKTFIKDKNLHLALITFFLLGIFLCLQPTPYLPTEWDEMSHWLTNPLQISLFQKLASEDFQNLPTLTYPPLHSISLALPNLIFPSVDPFHAPYIVGAQISWLCLFSGLAIILRKHLGAVGLAGILSLFFLRGLPSDVLIEWPQYHLLTVLLLVLSDFLKLKGWQEWILVVLCAIELNWLKNSNSFLLIPMLAFLGPRRGWFFALSAVAAFLSLSMTGLALWKTQAEFVDYPFKLGGISHLPTSEMLRESSLVFGKMLKKIFNFIGFPEVLVTIGLLVVGRKKGQKSFVPKTPFVFTAVAYFLAMLIMYIFFFSAVEAKIIASFERYLSVFVLPLAFVYSLHHLSWFKELIRPEYKRWLIFALVFVGVFRFVEPRWKAKTAMPTYEKVWQNVSRQLSDPKPSIMLVAQKDNGFHLNHLRYASLKSFPRIIHWQKEYSYSDVEINYWTHSLGEKFYQNLEKVNYILVLQEDEEISQPLRSLSFQTKECSIATIEKPVLYYKREGLWQCQKLQ